MIDSLNHQGHDKETRDKGIPHRQVPEMLVLKMKDPLIRDLRKLSGKTASVNGMRLGGQSFGDRFIEDGYVYRITRVKSAMDAAAVRSSEAGRHPCLTYFPSFAPK